MRAADIRGHDDDSIAKIDGAAMAICEPAVIEQLQQDVEDFGMRFFNLIKKDHRIGATPDRLGELASFLIPDVAGGRSDET